MWKFAPRKELCLPILSLLRAEMYTFHRVIDVKVQTCKNDNRLRTSVSSLIPQMWMIIDILGDKGLCLVKLIFHYSFL